MNPIAVGRLLRANTSGCVFGCRVSQHESPTFGQMIRIPLLDGSQIFGLVHEIHIDDDGLVRQLATSSDLAEEIIEDNRVNRNMPVEMSVVFIGWQNGNKFSQTRPPRPPLSLDQIFICSDHEINTFTTNGRFAYLRALLRNQDLPAADLLTAHLQQVMKVTNSKPLIEKAINEIVVLMKDDYPQLMDVLSAISEELA